MLSAMPMLLLCLQAAIMVKKLLVPTDDEFNEHKKKQLMELASLNGQFWGPAGGLTAWLAAIGCCAQQALPCWG